MTLKSNVQELGVASILGVLRGVGVHALIYPLQLVNTHQQAYPGVRADQVACRLFQTEGIVAFYKGMNSQLLKVCLKPAWVWPILAKGPTFWSHCGANDSGAQALTGVAVATADAFGLFYLDQRRIQQSLSRPATTYGLNYYWAKLTVNWTSFLVAQHCLRTQIQSRQQESLNSLQLAGIGVAVSGFVGMCSGPFDVAYTRKVADNAPWTTLFSKRLLGKGGTIAMCYAGTPLSFCMRVIHNVATVSLLEYLQPTSAQSGTGAPLEKLSS